MALWLEGELDSRPGYQPRHGPDEETRELIPVLAAACRAGYVTDCSQPGHGPQSGFDGLLWQQRAAVAGFINDMVLLGSLVDEAERAGLHVVIRDPMDTPGEYGVPIATAGEAGVDVTLRGETAHTVFGAPLDDLDLMWGGCSRQAFDAVAAAAHLTLIDPEFADTTRLWEVLTRVAAGELKG